MIFAYSGKDIIVTEEDYVAMFIDVDSQDSTTSIPKHPLKKFRFSKLCEDLRPSTFSSSNSLESFSTSQRSSTSRVFRMVKTNKNGTYSERLVLCEEDSNPSLATSQRYQRTPFTILKWIHSALLQTHTSSSLVASGSELVDMDALMHQWMNIDEFTSSP
ncbi:hypothetical protein BT96DRAFT_926720 [Gymnopus androsaceus JB14]|uniref:Uncharacterized protein n=1 Tax=Gymnopus androsaceus JB14 TaxID=1447944 RepID=A0A6A4GVJ0_9AGAR|nr:hypothetical protein BT96DRAFT_926720 [Gymnopus androsaceus JB14]